MSKATRLLGGDEHHKQSRDYLDCNVVAHKDGGMCELKPYSAEITIINLAF